MSKVVDVIGIRTYRCSENEVTQEWQNPGIVKQLENIISRAFCRFVKANK